MSARSFFIYLLIDPHDGQPRYVGQSDDPKRRLREHLSRRQRLTPKNGWLNELASQGLVPEIKVIEEFAFTSQQDANCREEKWIAHYQSEGWLFNRQEGHYQREGFGISRDQDRGNVSIPDNDWGRARSARWQIEDRTREMQVTAFSMIVQIKALQGIAQTEKQKVFIESVTEDLEKVIGKLGGN